MKKNKDIKNVLAKDPDLGLFENGLGDALGFGGGLGGFPGNQGTGFSNQIENVNTIFYNLRWYLISNFRQVLCQVYVELGLVQTIVDVPVDDALRGGVDIHSKQLDEDQIKDLQISMDRDDDLGTAGQAEKWNRLFGGAGILIMTDQDPSEPLDLDALTDDAPLEYRAVDMWELFWDKQNTEGYDPTIQEEDVEYFSYYGIQVHKSRVMRMKGLVAPSFIRPRLRGWGYSVVEKLVRSLNQYLKATDLGFEVLDEFKLDVYKIKNLTNTLLSPQGEQQVKKRIQLANWNKNYQNAVVMDSEDDFDHKTLSFAGLAEAMAGIRMQVASDMRMPLTKLFGISAAGFNSGEDDIEVYNGMVENEVRNKIKYVILRMIEVKCKKLFGFIPDDLEIKFKPLRILSSEQEEAVKTQKFTRLLQAKTANEITTYEFREACNKDNLLGITLDNADDELNLDDPQIADLVSGAGEFAAGEDGNSDNTGANKEDTQKSKAPAKDTKESPPPKERLASKQPGGETQSAKIAPDSKVKNSIDFDKAAYEADGGENLYADGRKPLFENPGTVDEGLWSKAKDAAKRAFGKENWKFTTWWYKKNGGKFK